MRREDTGSGIPPVAGQLRDLPHRRRGAGWLPAWVVMIAGTGSLLLFTAVAMAQEGGFLHSLDVDVHGFVDVRGGVRTQDDPDEKNETLGEARFQLDLERMGDVSTMKIRSDFLHDDVPENDDLDLEGGTGAVDLREASILLSPLDFLDVKVGRQILTWGTGDLLFINDMFPKDWQSFFIGRDLEYLKAPSDAVFISLFPGSVSIDISYTPRFDSDRYVSGDRLSYWNPMLGARAGRNAVIDPDKPDEWFDDDEIAMRVSRNAMGYELAAYAYDGYWKTPQGMDPTTMTAFFPKLSVYGASVRGGLGKGLINLEGGYYNSKDDSDGVDPFVPNDEVRGLVGYERELMKNLAIGLQYYVEHMQNHDNFKSNLPEGQNTGHDSSSEASAKEEDRQVATIRLTKQALNQNLTLSLFAYYSPTDQDAYLRPIIKYKVTDAWLVTAGGNVFIGENDHTFFGQFEKNNNVYGGVRYSF